MADDNPQNQEEKIDPIQLFTPSVRHVVEGLSYLGHISETITFAGHKFGLQTLRPEYKYAIGRVIQSLNQTLVADKAWRDAHIAAALTHVDGHFDFCDAIGPDIDSFILGRWQYITNSKTGWFETTLEHLWYQYQLLEMKADQAVNQLNFLSQQTKESPALLRNLEDILKESAALGDEINSDML